MPFLWNFTSLDFNLYQSSMSKLFSAYRKTYILLNKRKLRGALIPKNLRFKRDSQKVFLQATL